jgi:hypothetical protein
MATIQTSVFGGSDLTVITVSGPITSREIIAQLERFYAGQPTANVLWDFRQAEIPQVAREDLAPILTVAKRLARAREGGKTALVFSRDSAYGVGQMYEEMSRLHDYPISQAVFRSDSEAMEWLTRREDVRTSAASSDPGTQPPGERGG